MLKCDFREHLIVKVTTRVSGCCVKFVLVVEDGGDPFGDGQML